jgi:hypothetical protein
MDEANWFRHDEKTSIDEEMTFVFSETVVVAADALFEPSSSNRPIQRFNHVACSRATLGTAE